MFIPPHERPTRTHGTGRRTGLGPRYNIYSAIICFLGYAPQPPADDWATRLGLARTALGLSQRNPPHRVDQSTLACWERGEREPTGIYATQAQRFFGGMPGCRTSASR